MTATQILFGRKGNADGHLGAGWADLDDHATWCQGPVSRLRMSRPPGAGDLVVELVLQPWVQPPALNRQRLELVANGAPVGAASVGIESALGFTVPREAVGRRDELILDLHCPDAASPASFRLSGDTRKFAFAVRRARAAFVPSPAKLHPRHLPPLPASPGEAPLSTKNVVRELCQIELHDLMIRIESLGYNCQHGLIQRGCGAEPPDLLRFVGIDVANLLDGLDHGFEGIDNPAETSLDISQQGPSEFILSTPRYGARWHSFTPADKADPQDVLRLQLRLLAFRREKFLERLQTGEKLFIYQRPEHDSEAHVLPILNALRRHGDNALLFVSVRPDAPSGSVDRMSPHLYRGNIRRLMPIGEDTQDDVRAWVSLCANGYRLWRESGHGH